MARPIAWFLLHPSRAKGTTTWLAGERAAYAVEDCGAFALDLVPGDAEDAVAGGD
jgi:hypothetical protein